MLDGVRFACTDKEFESSYQLRYKIYVEEMGRLKEKANDLSGELRDLYDEHARTIIFVKNKVTIGTLRILWGGDKSFDKNLIKTYNLSPFQKDLKNDEICIVERLMVDRNHRGSSTLLHLYKVFLRFVIDNKIELLMLASIPGQVNHYLRLGGHVFTKPFLYPGIGPTIPIAQAMGDYSHMTNMNSPFAILSNRNDFEHFKKIQIINEIILKEQAKSSQLKGLHQPFIENPLQHKLKQPSSDSILHNRLQLKVGVA